MYAKYSGVKGMIAVTYFSMVEMGRVNMTKC